MNTGILATAWMCLVLSQSPNDGVEYFNHRNHLIPLKNLDAHRGEIQQLILYVSTDQGRNWEQATSVSPDKNAFAFYAKRDGSHWLRVATVSKSGKQEPDDKSLMVEPPDLKMIIDTVQPIIRKIQAQRQADEVYVSWDVQEENPDRAGILLEYQAKDSPPGSAWTAVPVPFALNGQAHFRPGIGAPLTVRLTMRDLAKNQSFALDEVAGTIATAAFFNQGGNASAPPAPSNNVPTLPAEMRVQAPPSSPISPIVAPPQNVEAAPYRVNSPERKDSFPPPMSQGPKQSETIPSPPGREMPTTLPAAKVIADSRLDPKPVEVKAPAKAPKVVGAEPNDPPFSPKPIVNPEPMRKPLPELTYLNNHQVTLEYAYKRVGPSGVGGVELWLTRDDGSNWERYAFAKEVQGEEIVGKQKRTFDLREKEKGNPFADGIYGMTLVVKNRAGLGREPHAGELPEIRFEIDTQAPLAVLYQPIPDPQHPDQVLLKWTAKDKNLSATPIQLEYAAKREGPWAPIKLDLANEGRYASKDITGDYSWKVTSEVPVQVFLRLRVRDKAGNESVAITPEPQFVDLTLPEGTLIKIEPTK